MTRQERELEQRRRSILREARKLFLRKGYDAVTIKEIAERSQFSRVTIYAYFQSKMDVFLPILFADLRRQYEALARVIERHDSAAEQLKAIGWEIYRFFEETPGLHLMIVQYHKQDLAREKVSERSLSEREEAIAIARDLFAGIMRRGMETGEFRADLDVDVAVPFYRKAIFAIVHAYVYDRELQLDRLDVELDYLVRAFTVV